MKKLILAAAGIGLTALLAPQANATLAATATDNGVAVPGFNCTVTGGGGGLNCSSTADPAFSLISLVGIGSPAIKQPDLSSLTLDATSAAGFTGTHVLGITLTQTNISQAVTGITSTFTVNNLVGGPFGPTTESTGWNGVATRRSTTFLANVTNETRSFTDPVAITVTDDSHSYAITFTAAGQTATDTIQLVGAVPEPTTLAVLGTGILGLGLVGLRRRR